MKLLKLPSAADPALTALSRLDRLAYRLSRHPAGNALPPGPRHEPTQPAQRADPSFAEMYSMVGRKRPGTPIVGAGSDEALARRLALEERKRTERRQARERRASASSAAAALAKGWQIDLFGSES